MNDTADELERFLAHRRQPLTIRRIVLFTHPRSVCGTLEMPTVDLITTSTEGITAFCETEGEAIEPTQVATLQNLIISDHRFNAERMKRRRAAHRARHKAQHR